MNDQDITTIIPQYWYLAKLCDSRNRINTRYNKYVDDIHGNIKKNGVTSGEEHIHVAWSCEIQHVRGGRLCEGAGKTPKEAIQAACAQARLKYPQLMPDYEAEEVIEKYDAENDILTIIEKIEPNKIFSTWNHGIQICKSFDDERIVGIRILNVTNLMKQEIQPATKYDKKDDIISIQLQHEPVCAIEIGNALIYQTINTKQITGIKVNNLSKIMTKP